MSAVEGIIKSYSNERGYGFISVAGERDVFLHVSRLGKFQPPSEGMCITFESEPNPKKGNALQVKRIFAIEAHMRRDGFERAEAKRFNCISGFGFVTRGVNTRDLFVHISTLQSAGMGPLKEGQIVWIRAGVSQRKRNAQEVVEIRPDSPRKMTTAQ